MARICFFQLMPACLTLPQTLYNSFNSQSLTCLLNSSNTIKLNRIIRYIAFVAGCRVFSLLLTHRLTEQKRSADQTQLLLQTLIQHLACLAALVHPQPRLLAETHPHHGKSAQNSWLSLAWPDQTQLWVSCQSTWCNAQAIRVYAGQYHIGHWHPTDNHCWSLKQLQ